MGAGNFSALVPVLPGHERELRAAIDALGTGEDSPFAAVAGTHITRLVILDAFGGPSEPRRRLRPALLTFSAMVDGPVEAWLRAMCTTLGAVGDCLWTHCSGWPGPDPAATAVWLGSFRIRLDVSLVGNPNASVEQVEKALRQRRNLLNLALEARHLSPAELRRRYETEVRA
jgi:hypothetical protein